jgi:hypothetical protein
MPITLRSYQRLLIKMKNRLDAIGLISLYRYALLQQQMVMALLSHLANLLKLIYYHNRLSEDNTRMVKIL